MGMLPLLLILVVVGFLFFNMRKQKRQVNQTTAMQEGLKVGDVVMTASGMHATVADLGEDTLDLEIAPGVVTTWVRRAVVKVVEPEVDDQEAYNTDAPSIESIEDETHGADLDKDSEPGDRGENR